MSEQSRIDPITLEVLWNRLVAVVNEQATALMRTSFTTIVRESGDLSAGVFDTRGNMIAQAVTGTPGHINAMATCIHHFLAAYPADTLQSGDVLITNDPQKTSGHLHDMTVITPIFREAAGGQGGRATERQGGGAAERQERLVGFFGSTCHVLDIGGRDYGTDARSVFEEGLFVPITKLFEAGVENRELIKILRANVRTPEPVLGDIHAQAAGNAVGGRRLLDFMSEFGLESLEPLADEIIGRSERAMRAAIRQVPDGIYEHTVYSDGYEEPVKIQVRVEIRDDEVWVDFAGSSPESTRGINVVLNYTHAYTTYALKCALAPEVPNNEGSFRPVHVAAPPRCILNAQPPAPVAARHIIGHFLPGAIFGALAQVLPDRVMAEGAANIWLTQITARSADEALWTYIWFSSGGTGARPTKDGISAAAFPSGISGVPAEIIESLAPIVVHRRAFRQDSGGAGTYRGGLGQTMEVSVRDERPFTFSLLFDRVHFPAQGYAGGRAGAPGRVTTSTGETIDRKGLRHFPAGTRVTLELPGGGGFYDPLARPTEAVRQDVLNGYVSTEAARTAYGVVLDPVTLTIDEEETDRQRESITSKAPAV